MAQLVNARDTMLQGGNTARYIKTATNYTSNTAPWTNTLAAGLSISSNTLTATVDSNILDPFGGASTKYSASGGNVYHGFTYPNLATGLVSGTAYKVQTTIYAKSAGDNSRIYIILAARTENPVSNQSYLLYDVSVAESKVIGSTLGAGWTATSISITNVGNGWLKITAKGTFTAGVQNMFYSSWRIIAPSPVSETYDNATNPASLYLYGAQAYFNEQPDEVIGDTWTNISTNTVSTWNRYHG